MKNRKELMLMAMLVLGLAMFQGNALAEMIEGKIVGLDLNANTLVIARTSPATGQMENLKITVAPSAALEGLDSIKDLKVGDEVTVNAAQDKQSGSFQATTIQVAK